MVTHAVEYNFYDTLGLFTWDMEVKKDKLIIFPHMSCGFFFLRRFSPVDNVFIPFQLSVIAFLKEQRFLYSNKRKRNQIKLCNVV